jgi:hypothetical protein
MFKKNYVRCDKAISMNTVKKKQKFFRPSVLHKIATDWIIGGCLKWCLMYSRDLYLIFYMLSQGYLKIFILI